jgi:hypothetical protein
MSDVDWMDGSFVFESDQSTLKKPPFAGLIVTTFFAVFSLILVFFQPSIGYLVAVIASSVGGFTAVSDQKKQGDANYISYSWFGSALRGVRFFALATAILNILLVAQEIASGGDLF